jgi:nucleotide-binding universal stress UspA family protein
LGPGREGCNETARGRDSTILVPVDFSKNSLRALEYAWSLASRYGAAVDVLHVWQFLTPDTPSIGGSQVSDLTAFVRSNAETELRKLAENAAHDGIAIRRTRAERGIPSQVILDPAKRDGNDLIVMGTRGRSGLAHVLLGSVAERVVRHAHCPVLTVRDKS